MRDKREFYSMVMEISGKDPSEYSRLAGDFDFSRYVLKVSNIAPETVSDPTLFIVRVPQTIAGFPDSSFGSPVRRTALEDFLTRKVGEHIEQLAQYDAQGVSRRHLSIAMPGQKILPRTALLVTEEYVEARLYVKLPLQDGRIDGERVKSIFFDELASIVNTALVYCNLVEHELAEFVDIMEDADQIRQSLPTRGFLGFVALGSMLTRMGKTDYPEYNSETPLTLDESVQTEMEVPNAGTVKGLGIPSGITLILGDDYSGRIELMRALAAGIYNHIPGDGRELAITVPDAVYISAEAGRSIQKVDISPFVRATAEGKGVSQFSAEEADPCSAEAASTIEALEVGARALLFDEADSCPAFLTSDTRLNGLFPDADRRIIPLSQRARQIADDLGVSLVIAGSASVAEFLPFADTVLRIEGFKVYDVTQEAKSMDMSQFEVAVASEPMGDLLDKNRYIVPSSIDPSKGTSDQLIEADDTDLLRFGRAIVELLNTSQLADKYQTSTIGVILYYAKLRYMDESRPIREIMDMIDRDLGTEGLECLSRDLRGDLARPRRYEIAAALNRLSSLRISHIE